MKIKLITIGTKMPGWVEQGCQEYTKRLPRELTLEWLELPLGHRGKGADLQRAIQKEGDQMLAAIADNDTVIALDVLGQSWSTEQLASELQDWQMQGSNLCLLIGGPDGLDPRCLARANKKWSLSALTYPHPLVRIVLAEQLYRAWSITQGHPYHK